MTSVYVNINITPFKQLEKVMHTKYMKDLVKGLKINNLTFLERTTRPESHKPNRKSYGLFLCDCGASKVLRCDIFLSGKQQTCGCFWISESYEFSLRNHKMVECYKSMLARCYNKKNPSYPDYGGRGIKVCEEWHNISNFFSDMESTHSEDLSLDREDVNGDYSPENCYWRDHSWQMYNKRQSSINTSGKTGVSFYKKDCDWEAYITVNNKKIGLGRYSTFEDAVKAREDAELKYFGRLKGN